MKKLLTILIIALSVTINIRASLTDGLIASYSSNNENFINAGNIFPPRQNTFTESFWIKSTQYQQPVGNGHLKHIVFMTRRTGYSYNGDGGWATLCINNQGNLSLTIDDANYGNECQNPNYNTSVVFDGKWHHIVGVKNNFNYFLFFDGKEIANITDHHVLSPSNGTKDFWIGRSVWNYTASTESSDLNASLKDIRIYNRALSSPEIQQLYSLKSSQQLSTLTPKTILTPPSPVLEPLVETNDINSTNKLEEKVDYSKIVEVGDIIGFEYSSAHPYIEGVIERTLSNSGEDEIKYSIKVTKDGYLPSLLGRHISVTKSDLKNMYWTMIKKHTTQ